MIEQQVSHSYQFTVTKQGHILAHCEQTGTEFYRFNRNVWWCKNTDAQVLEDQTLADLERGYAQYQSQQDRQQRPRPARNGHATMHAPHMPAKGRASHREPRGKGRAE